MGRTERLGSFLLEQPEGVFPLGEDTLALGRFATVRIQLQEIPDAIAVPTEAIVPEMGVARVFRYRNGRAEAVEVQTGLRTDASVQILSGLQPGDTVITSGTLQLRTDLPVKLDAVE